MNKQIEWCQDYIQRNLSKMNYIWDVKIKELRKRGIYSHELSFLKCKGEYNKTIQKDYLDYLKNSKIDNNTLIRISKSLYEIIEFVEENSYFTPPKKAHVKLYRVKKKGYYKNKENIGCTHYLHLYVYDDSHKVILEKIKEGI